MGCGAKYLVGRVGSQIFGLERGSRVLGLEGGEPNTWLGGWGAKYFVGRVGAKYLVGRVGSQILGWERKMHLHASVGVRGATDWVRLEVFN